MNLSALQVTFLPQGEEQVIQQLQSLDWAEAFHREAGRMIVIIESETIDQDANRMRELQRLDGVLSVDLVEYRQVL